MDAETDTDGRTHRLREDLAAAHDVAPELIRTIASPYRICPIGAHSDHQGGPTLGMAISVYTHLAYAPANSREVVLTSENFPGEVRFDVSRPGNRSGEADGWADYPRGVSWALRSRLPSAARGIVGRIAGDLPGGGLSSSASVTLAYLLAIADANAIELDPRERVELALTAEREYVGVHVGILDPATIVGSRAGHLLAINTRDVRWEALPLGNAAPEYRVLVAFAGLARRLRGTPFNERVEECLRAARRLADLDDRKGVERLSDLPERVFREHAGDIPANEAKRARHFFDERARVQQGTTLWRTGDLEAFGRLMNESCASSIDNWESGSDELIAAQAILSETPGVFGSRFSGAGFGGCCVALVDAARADAARDGVQAALEARLPDAQPRVFLADGVDGVRGR